MAKDYMAIPGIYLFYYNYFLIYYIINQLFIIGTSVPVECVFSGGTDLISQRRSSLAPETIRMCMCLKSWWKLE